MKRAIEVIVSPSGDIQIDAVGFIGADCEKATKFLEDALGTIGTKVKKPEYQQSRHTKAQQRIGR